MALSDNLVGYWSAWQGSSGYRLLDRSTQANHGILTNMDAGTDWVGSCHAGKSGYALDFDGTNDYVDVSLSATRFSLTSMVAWALPFTMTGTQRGMLSWAPATFSPTPFILLTQENPGNSARIYVDNGYRKTLTLDLNKWNMISICQEPSFLWRFYLNGVSVGTYQGTSTVSGKSTATKIIMGNGFNGNFLGQIAAVSAWSRGVMQAENLELYRLGPGWYQPYRQKRYAFVGGAAGFRSYWARRQSQLIGGGV